MTAFSGTVQADRDFTYYGDDYRYDDVSYRFSDRAMGTRYRSRYKDPKLCNELQEEVIVARGIFEGSLERKRSSQYDADRANTELNSRTAALSRANSRVMNASRRLQNLKNTQANFNELMAQYQAEASQAQFVYDQAQANVETLRAIREDKCDGFGRISFSCIGAKSDVKKAKKVAEKKASILTTANAQVDRLNRLPSDLEAAQREVVAANQNLSQEETKTPAISELQSNADAANANYSNILSQFNSDEDNFGRKAVRFEQCRRMAFDARKGKSYKRALVRLSKNNGQNCQKVANRLLSNVRGYAARQGIKEAYEDYCVSERLVRKVYVDPAPVQ